MSIVIIKIIIRRGMYLLFVKWIVIDLGFVIVVIEIVFGNWGYI